MRENYTIKVSNFLPVVGMVNFSNSICIKRVENEGNKSFITECRLRFAAFSGYEWSNHHCTLITGLNVSVALFTAGVGTLIFTFSKGKFLFSGSSFAFIGVVSMIGAEYGLEYATGGVFVAGLIYVLLPSLLNWWAWKKSTVSFHRWSQAP